MIDIKSPQEREAMRIGGRMLGNALNTVMRDISPGISEIEIDKKAERLIREQGGEPGFKKVKGYHHTICAATNDVVVHGVPSDYRFKEGDVVCIDCGVYYKGLHTDMAETVLVAGSKGQALKGNKEKERFLQIGKKALAEAIKVAVIGNRVGHISKSIQDIVEGAGYSVVRNLVGHGVGKELHEEPEVPGFLDRPIAKTPLLKEGMTIAIEVIYAMGKSDVVYAGSDGWTIKMADSSLSAVFERTVLIEKDGPEILTG